MKLRVLVIDDDGDWRRLLEHHLTTRWPDAVVAHHDPTREGLPTPETLEAHDLMLLDHQPAGESGVAWLARLRARRACPPAIMLLPGGDERLAIEAIAGGADDYLPKSGLDNALVVRAVRETLRARTDRVREPRVAPRPVDRSLRHGVEVKGYSLQETLARRRDATVFLASSEHHPSPLALKVLWQDAEGGHTTLDRFLQECDLVARLRHPGVVRIYDHGVTDDLVYIAMEHFPRGDLKMRLRDPLQAEQALAYAAQVASALEAIHGVGVLHRDLKPANVMLRDDDSAVLIDFGHAKQMWMEAALTDNGEVFGTPYYMSPEQGHGETLDERSDLYSLGVLLYEMLAGSKPYTASTPLAVIYKHIHSPVPQLPEHLGIYQPLIDRTMAKHRNGRFASAGELATVLTRLAKNCTLEAV